jgi:RraA family protein
LPLGLRILPSPPPLDPAIVARYAKLPTGNVADSMGRFRAMSGHIRSWVPGRVLCGAAVTVLTRAGDNLMVHKALEVARPGEVVVVDTTGGYRAAVVGELMTYTAIGAGLAGFVIDGAIRDLAELRELGLPVFAAALAATACDKDGPGEINVPVACGGVVVAPGDLVLGDDDGVVVVPREHVDEVLEFAEAKHRSEIERVREIRQGQLFMPEINAALRSKGVL